jgi:hypothetical protein
MIAETNSDCPILESFNVTVRIGSAYGYSDFA